MKKWSETAWQCASEAYEAITRLPFLQELSKGTLPYENFMFYITQDNLYIDVYSRVLAHIASRLPLMSDTETFLAFAGDGVAVEKGLHASFNPPQNAQKSMACEFYVSYLKAQMSEELAVEAAAILPCFWVYQKVGEHILATADLEGNPYRAWIEMYGDPGFDISTKKAIDVCDRLAEAATEETRQKMTQAFIDCTKLEWLFWDSAYKQESWPV